MAPWEKHHVSLVNATPMVDDPASYDTCQFCVQTTCPFFWDGELTYVTQNSKGGTGDLQIGDKKKQRIESPGGKKNTHPIKCITCLLYLVVLEDEVLTKKNNSLSLSFHCVSY